MDENNTIGRSVLNQIKKDIISGSLKPSSKLKLDNLKSHYSVSTSTIRETLNRLVSEGFVKAEEQRGFFVCPFSETDLIEIVKIRNLIESYGIEQSIQKSNIEWESKVVSAYHRLNLEEKNNLKNESIFNEWKKYDFEFHEILVSNCDSANLMSIHSNLLDRHRRYQTILHQTRGQKSILEHEEIFNAVLNKDIKKTIKILQIHLDQGLEKALTLFKK